MADRGPSPANRKRSLRAGRHVAAGTRPARVGQPVETPYLATAVGLAEQLIRTARRTPAGVTWEGDDLLGEDEASLKLVRGPIGPDLYGGAAGIGWFLGHLAASIRVAAVADTALAALRAALNATTETLSAERLSIGSGATGVAFAAVDVAVRLRRPGLRRLGLQLAHAIASAVRHDPDAFHEADLIGGLAGIVIGMLAIHRRAPDPVFVEACRAACDRLIALRQVDGFGTSWPDRTAPDAPGLCGLAHGASGVAWALAEAKWATGAPDLEPIVDDALRYERGWFASEGCTWADLRQPRSNPDLAAWPAWTTAWCHGALGIGAARLRVYEVDRDLTALAEASAAIEAGRAMVAGASALLRQSQASDVTLCHGLGGAVELMLLAYEVTGLPDHLRAARRAGDVCLAIGNRGRWTVGLNGAELVPGLFLGLAGIGVTMLRLHDPSCIASPMLPGRSRYAGPAARVVSP